jgi:hypothetical protein
MAGTPPMTVGQVLNPAQDHGYPHKHPDHHDGVTQVAHPDPLLMTGVFHDPVSLEQGHHLDPAPWHNLDATHSMIDAHPQAAQ